MKQLLPVLLVSMTGALAADADIASLPAHVIVSPWRQYIPPTKRQGQAPDGTVHVIYDHQSTQLGEILMATFSEEDVRLGKQVT